MKLALLQSKSGPLQPWQADRRTRLNYCVGQPAFGALEAGRTDSILAGIAIKEHPGDGSAGHENLANHVARPLVVWLVLQRRHCVSLRILQMTPFLLSLGQRSKFVRIERSARQAPENRCRIGGPSSIQEPVRDLDQVGSGEEQVGWRSDAAPRRTTLAAGGEPGRCKGRMRRARRIRVRRFRAIGALSSA